MVDWAIGVENKGVRALRLGSFRASVPRGCSGRVQGRRENGPSRGRVKGKEASVSASLHHL